MEKYDTLIDAGRDGLHCILFKNHDVLDKKEIEDIFSQFGRVHNVRFHGVQKGICFVRYQHEDEAIRAVEGLEGNTQITLLEHDKKKQKNGFHAERSQGSDHRRKNCDGSRFTQQFSRQTNQENGKSGYNRKGDNKENFQNNLPRAPKSAIGNQKQNEVPWAQQGPNGYQKQNNTFPGPINPRSHQGSNDELPDLDNGDRQTMAGIQNQSIEVPELVTADGRTFKKSSSIKKQIIVAQEVIVANIHPKFGSPYILHLFDSYQPLAITDVMVEPKTGKRYCHVYFKSVEESRAVETSFDKKLLLDQRLVVIQSNRLVESTYFK